MGKKATAEAEALAVIQAPTEATQITMKEGLIGMARGRRTRPTQRVRTKSATRQEMSRVTTTTGTNRLTLLEVPADLRRIIPDHPRIIQITKIHSYHLAKTGEDIQSSITLFQS